MEVKIIELSQERTNEYRLLRLESLKSDPKAFGKNRKDIISELNKPFTEWQNDVSFSSTKTLFAEIPATGELVGMISINRFIDGLNLDKVRLSKFFVTPEYRHNKIGIALFEKALQVCKTYHAKEIKLNVVVSQKMAYQMYRKFGFKTTSWGFNIKKLILYRNMSLKI